MPVARHDKLQDQYRSPRGVPSGHVQGQHRGRLTDTEELDFLAGRVPGNNLLDDVINAGVLRRADVRGPASNGLSLPGRCRRPAPRNPPGDDL